MKVIVLSVLLSLCGCTIVMVEVDAQVTVVTE